MSESNINKDIIRLKIIIRVFMLAVMILFAIELALTNFDHIEVAFSVTLLLLVGLYYWLDEDTVQVVGGVLIWSVNTLIFYFTWVNRGLFDTAMLAYPSILLLAFIMGSRLIYIPLLISIIVQVIVVFVGHQLGAISQELIVNTNLVLRTSNIIIMLSMFGLISYLFVRSFKQQLDKTNQEKKTYIAKLKKSQNLLQRDPLTKLPNEYVCQNEISALLKEMKSNHAVLAFMVLDIINLRQINNSFGHNIGDKLLVEIANRLLILAQEQEFIYRFHGNEFVLVKSAIETKEIDVLKERVLQAIVTEFNIDDYEISALCSLGISVAPFDGETLEELRAKAHLALQYGKTQHKNIAQYYKPEIKTQIDNKFIFMGEIKQAIRNREFLVYYQPKVNLQTEKIVGVEALVRWQHPQKGWIPPNVFIPAAEEAGLISEITKFVLKTACRECVKWQQAGFKDISVAINLSAVDFKRGNLPQLISSTLAQTEMSPHLLELEITESTIFDDITYIQSQIRQLQQKGISFAIDDFGTGYSNLGYLEKFNVSVLKIDQSFVKKVAEAEHEKHIVNAIITLSKSLEIINVAEGIENEYTASWLRYAGCQIGQGYYWYKPMPYNELLTTLKTEK